MSGIEDPRDPAALVRQVAEALFAYNTNAGLHFVSHNGGYEGIAKAALDSLDLYPTSVYYRHGIPFEVQYSTPHLRVNPETPAAATASGTPNEQEKTT